MNRVYKVIWSKAKHCYVVTSEIARSVTKSASSARSAGRKGAAVLAMAALLFTAGGVLGEAANVVTDVKQGSTTDVITVTIDDSTKTTTKDITINDVAHATKATQDGDGKEISTTYAKIADVEKDYVKKTDGNIVTTGDIVTTGNLTAHGIVATGDIKGNAITGTSLNTQGGAISGGAITGTTITGTSLNTQNGEINGGDIKSGGIIIAKGKITGNGLDAGSGAVEGNSLKLKGGDLDAGSGTITTKGNIKADGTITTNNLAVTGGLETDHITLGSEPLNYTKIDKGNVTSKVNENVSGVEYIAESIFNKDGSSITARIDEGATGKSIVGAKEISQYLGNKAEPKSSDKKVTRNMVRNDDGTFSMEDKAVDGTKSSTVSQNAGERKVTVIDGNNKASTNLSNKGFNTFASDGTNKTYTKQTAVDIKNTAKNGMISNTAKNLVNTASENMTNTVGKNLTTTVGGDSSLTAENITNEAKNKITNKALDVETDAASSIVSKVSNDYGSNTSTQLSHQTMEEMKAEGKTASYLRGAAEEKSQLTDGAKKTTIDTVAGQTNTNITEGKNVSNSLQKADQIASSVTDGTNTTVVNQNAGSLASSITDGTKANNTSSTVDKSEQLIKVDNTHFYAETKTAGSAVEALKSDGNTIISAKDAVTGTVSSAVTDGTNTTGSTMTAKGITNSAAESIVNEIGDGSKVKSEMTAKGITNTAKDGTITNDAKDLVNTASNSITDKVGENVERTMGTKKIEESVKDGTKSNTFTKTYDKDINVVTDGTNTSRESQLADRVNTSLKEVDGDKTTKSLNNVKTVSEDTTKITDTTSGAFSSSSQKADSITSTVKDTEKGTISERSQTVSQVQDKVGTTTVTTTDGLTKLINKEGTHKTVMDYANVTKDLNVNGDATVDQKLTVKGDSDLQGNATVGKNLEVKGTSTLTGDVTMESNATVTKDLTVKGASEFVGRADFRYDVYVDNNLTVAKETRTDTLYVDHDGYVGGNLNVAGNIETHDAVLSADSRQVVTGRQLYQTNERVDRLDNRIKKVGANAAALAALRPGDFNPDDKFSIAAGFGSYRNANAAALGLFYRPNENVLLSLGTSFGDGENMVNAGVSVKFGRGKSMAERRKEMADEVSSMRDEMRSQDERIAELEEMLKKQSELIEKLSKES